MRAEASAPEYWPPGALWCCETKGASIPVHVPTICTYYLHDHPPSIPQPKVQAPTVYIHQLPTWSCRFVRLLHSFLLTAHTFLLYARSMWSASSAYSIDKDNDIHSPPPLLTTPSASRRCPTRFINRSIVSQAPIPAKLRSSRI